MYQRSIEWIRQATGVGFTAGILLIAFGLAGLEATLGLATGVLVVGVAGIAVRRTLRGTIDHPAFAAYLASVPLAPLLAGAVVVAFLGASPGELQTLGGVLGLLAILNHMFRPVYALVSALCSRISSALA